jgi:diguanylate cyclase (GGDEF)-like protein
VIERRDLKETLQIIIDEIIEATKSKKIFLIILNDGGTVSCFSSSDYGKKAENVQELLNQKNNDYWVNILPDKRPLIFSDKSELTEQVVELKSLLDLKTGVVSPFYRYDALAGLLFLGDKEEEEFTTGDLPTISAFTDLISIACENTRLYLQLEILSSTDMVSGVKNQRYFRERLEQEFLRALRHNLSLSLAVIDIVNFKKINEMIGYNKADVILAEFGRMIKESTRSIDIPARIIADEFAILFPETPLQSAQLAIERLRKKSNEFFATSEVVPPGINISFDVGLVICNDKMSDENEFYDLACSKLKEAKEKRTKKVAGK